MMSPIFLRLAFHRHVKEERISDRVLTEEQVSNAMTLKTYLFDRINSRKFRLNGIWPSKRLPNKQKLCQSFRNHVLYTPEQLPPKVDLRKDMTPVEDQSKIGSCAANCLAGAYEYLTKKSDGRNTDVSRLFIYYNARAKEKKSNVLTDSGCTMTSAIEALEEFGACLESIWPYDISQVHARPNDRAFDEAKNHKITEALQVEIDLNEMKSCLAQGFPFAFGLQLFKSFDKGSTAGAVPMPNASDRIRASHGSHALLAVGYSDNSESFIVRNSWGENWGDGGYCYIPYGYMTNPELCFDAWAVRKLANDNFSQEHWDKADSINYLKAAMLAVMSMGFDNNEHSCSNDDNNDCVIEDVVEEDEPFFSGSTLDHGGRTDQWTNSSGWERYNDNAAASSSGYQQRDNDASYYNAPGNHFSAPYGQQQQYAGGGQYYQQQPPWSGTPYSPYDTNSQPNNYFPNQQIPNQYPTNDYQGSYPHYGGQPNYPPFPTYGMAPGDQQNAPCPGGMNFPGGGNPGQSTGFASNNPPYNYPNQYEQWRQF